MSLFDPEDRVACSGCGHTFRAGDLFDVPREGELLRLCVDCVEVDEIIEGIRFLVAHAADRAREAGRPLSAEQRADLEREYTDQALGPWRAHLNDWFLKERRRILETYGIDDPDHDDHHDERDGDDAAEHDGDDAAGELGADP